MDSTIKSVYQYQVDSTIQSIYQYQTDSTYPVRTSVSDGPDVLYHPVSIPVPDGPPVSTLPQYQMDLDLLDLRHALYICTSVTFAHILSEEPNRQQLSYLFVSVLFAEEERRKGFSRNLHSILFCLIKKRLFNLLCACFFLFFLLTWSVPQYQMDLVLLDQCPSTNIVFTW